MFRIKFCELLCGPHISPGPPSPRQKKHESAACQMESVPSCTLEVGANRSCIPRANCSILFLVQCNDRPFYLWHKTPARTCECIFELCSLPSLLCNHHHRRICNIRAQEKRVSCWPSECVFVDNIFRYWSTRPLLSEP